MVRDFLVYTIIFFIFLGILFIIPFLYFFMFDWFLNVFLHNNFGIKLVGIKDIIFLILFYFLLIAPFLRRGDNNKKDKEGIKGSFKKMFDNISKN